MRAVCIAFVSGVCAAAEGGPYSAQGPIATFFDKVCFSDSECSSTERCAPTLNPFTKPNTLIGMITPKTCQPKALPPGYASSDLLHHSVNLEDTLTMESLDDVLMSSVVELDKPSGAQVDCRAVKREAQLGDVVKLYTGGLQNDLFNITLPRTINADKVLINIKETQTLIKVPEQFLFNCDAVGNFKLKFRVYLTNMSGGMLRDGQQTCAAEITCVPATYGRSQKIIPPAFKLPAQIDTNSDNLTGSQFDLDLQQANKQAREIAFGGLSLESSPERNNRRDEVGENAPGLAGISDNLKQLLIAEFIRGRLEAASTSSSSTSTTSTTTTTPASAVAQDQPIDIECSNLSVDAKVHRPLTIALGSTLYRLIGGNGTATVLIPGTGDDTQSLTVNCDQPGIESKYAVIFAQSENRQEHALKSCPININCLPNSPPTLECRHDVLEVRAKVGSTRTTSLDITSLHQNPVYQVHDADGDPLTVAVQDTRSAKVKFSLSHQCGNVFEPSTTRESYLVTAFDGEDHSTVLCAVDFICE